MSLENIDITEEVVERIDSEAAVSGMRCLSCENRRRSDICLLSNKVFVWLAAVGCLGYLCGVKLAVVIRSENAAKKRLAKHRTKRSDGVDDANPKIVVLTPSSESPVQDSNKRDAVAYSSTGSDTSPERSTGKLVPEEQPERYEDDRRLEDEHEESVL